MKYEAHQDATLFPPATAAELGEMAADIKARGLLHPIILLDGHILDGRNRYAACAAAGVAPQFTEYAGNDPLADVISWNLHRRQLSTSQRAALAVELKPLFEKRARERRLSALKRGDEKPVSPNSGQRENKGKTAEQVAQAVGVGKSIVDEAGRVRREAPEMFEAVKAGELTVNAARRKARAKKEKEKQPSAGRQPKTASKAMEHAADAIRELRKIGQNDPARREAFRTVRKWVTDNE